MGKVLDFSTYFWSRIEKSEHCWMWKGSKRRGGYGRLMRQGKVLTSHRVAWELTYGPIPQGLCVLHHCDNPPCCRPDHLFLGDDMSNSLDMRSKRRQNYEPHFTALAKAARKLRKFTPEQVMEIKEALKHVPSKNIGRLPGGILPTNTIRGLARKYGVMHSTIRAIKNGLTYKDK